MIWRVTAPVPGPTSRTRLVSGEWLATKSRQGGGQESPAGENRPGGVEIPDEFPKKQRVLGESARHVADSIARRFRRHALGRQSVGLNERRYGPAVWATVGPRVAVLGAATAKRRASCVGSWADCFTAGFFFGGGGSRLRACLRSRILWA